MAVNGNEDDLFTIMFIVTKKDVLTWTNEMGMPLDQVTDDVVISLKQKIQQEAGGWQELFESLVKKAIGCPLNMVCSPSCPWREIGECKSSTTLKD